MRDLAFSFDEWADEYFVRFEIGRKREGRGGVEERVGGEVRSFVEGVCFEDGGGVVLEIEDVLEVGG